MLVAGVDSSTQSTKVLLCDGDDGTVIGRGMAPHPDGTECDPAAWWAALQQAGEGLLSRAAAVGVAGQQHGCRAGRGGPVSGPPCCGTTCARLRPRPAGREARRPGGWASSTGRVPTASFTVTKLRWLADHEPASAAGAVAVALPHDWLTWRLPAPGHRPGRRRPPPGCPDRGMAGPIPRRGVGPADWADRLPTVLGPTAAAGPPSAAGLVGRTSPVEWWTPARATTWPPPSAWVGPGAGGVSLGTSGTVYAAATVPVADPTGTVAGFADATGGYLPLACTLNATRVPTPWAVCSP